MSAAGFFPSAQWVADAVLGDRLPHLRRALEGCGYPIPEIKAVNVGVDFGGQDLAVVVSVEQAGRLAFWDFPRLRKW